jgi:hypothetical protein
VQRLLRESGREEVPGDIVAVVPEGVEAQADWAELRSPETYLTGSPSLRGAVDLSLNEWSLLGDWTTTSQARVLTEAGGGVAFRFHARDVNLVLGPTDRRTGPIRFRVTLDGKPPAAARGLDVDADGRGEVVEQRLYQLIRQPGPIADRTFEIDFEAAGVGAYVFTFG